MITLIPALPAHAYQMDFRSMHLEEARIHKIDPAAETARQVVMSLEARTALVDGAVGAVFGLYAPNVLGDEAYPWIVAAPIAEQQQKYFLRESYHWICHWCTMYPRLVALCSDPNQRSARWLEWMGFIEDGSTPGFRRFVLRRM